MFRTLQNTARIDFTISPDGPILVRAQSVGIDPGVAEIEFQRTRRNGESTVFLAGSGLKGVLRSHSERLVRSAGRFACDPTKTNMKVPEARFTCGIRRPNGPKPGDYVDPYRHGGNCAACFTFGSLKLAGRFRVADAYPSETTWEETNRTEVRTGVGIDRKSQASAQGALYDTEVVVSGGFEAHVQGENFSLWQLGLILSALRDLDDGLVKIGGGKARGMGTVRVESLKIELGFLNGDTGKITGAKISRPEEKEYGLPAEDLIPFPAGTGDSQRGLFRIAVFEGQAVESLATILIEGPLARYLQGKP